MSPPSSPAGNTGAAGSRITGEPMRAASSPGVTGGSGMEPGVPLALDGPEKSRDETGVKVRELEGEGWFGATLTEACGVRSWSSSMAVTAVRLL